MIVSSTTMDSPWQTQCSYARAFVALGCEVEEFSLQEAVDKYCRLGVVGRLINAYNPIDAWVRKANRDLVVAVQDFQADVLIIVGQTPLTAGALAQLRATTRPRSVLLWPDTLLNLSASEVATVPLFDLVATYGDATVDTFRTLGGKEVAWVALAADEKRFESLGEGDKFRAAYQCDVSFVGNWTTEREATLLAIAGMPDTSLKIWGSTWGRVPALSSIWQGEGPAKDDTAMAALESTICINLINAMNHPCANLRFFEIPCAGGLQLSSRCPEMESSFIDGETVFYFDDIEDIVAKIPKLLADPELLERVTKAGQAKVMAEHTHLQRAQQIIDLLELAVTPALKPALKLD
ncbi:glycosyltransferase [Endomicrobium sp. AH-315-J14]|nr:glycosyltransferase [Endomicrobium sp. AH-315-J14]